MAKERICRNATEFLSLTGVVQIDRERESAVVIKAPLRLKHTGGGGFGKKRRNKGAIIKAVSVAMLGRILVIR